MTVTNFETSSSVSSSEENHVGKMLSTCSEYTNYSYRVGHVGGECCSLLKYVDRIEDLHPIRYLIWLLVFGEGH